LELLLNSLLEKESSPLPYAFYVNNMEVTVSLEETLTQIQQSKAEINSQKQAQMVEISRHSKIQLRFPISPYQCSEFDQSLDASRLFKLNTII